MPMAILPRVGMKIVEADALEKLVSLRPFFREGKTSGDLNVDC